MRPPACSSGEGECGAVGRLPCCSARLAGRELRRSTARSSSTYFLNNVLDRTKNQLRNTPGLPREAGSACITSIIEEMEDPMSANGYAKDVLVSTDWLAEHLDDDNVVVAEVDENPDLYDEGHIASARPSRTTTVRGRSGATSST